MGRFDLRAHGSDLVDGLFDVESEFLHQERRDERGRPGHSGLAVHEDALAVVERGVDEPRRRDKVLGNVGRLGVVDGYSVHVDAARSVILLAHCEQDETRRGEVRSGPSESSETQRDSLADTMHPMPFWASESESWDAW